MRWLIVFFIGLASFAQTSEARACSCMKLSPSEGLTLLSCGLHGRGHQARAEHGDQVWWRRGDAPREEGLERRHPRAGRGPHGRATALPADTASRLGRRTWSTPAVTRQTRCESASAAGPRRSQTRKKTSIFSASQSSSSMTPRRTARDDAAKTTAVRPRGLLPHGSAGWCSCLPAGTRPAPSRLTPERKIKLAIRCTPAFTAHPHGVDLLLSSAAAPHHPSPRSWRTWPREM